MTILKKHFMLLLFFTATLYSCRLKANPVFEDDKTALFLARNTTAEETDFLACFDLKNGWHISYQNPGDAGVATEFEFENTEGLFLASSAPEKFLYEEIITQYGYASRGCYLYKLAHADAYAKVHISWTACKDYCEPKEFEILLNEVETEPYHDLYTKALPTFPKHLEQTVLAEKKGNKLILHIGKNLDADTYFIPTENIFNADAPQILQDKGTKSILTIETDGLEELPESGLFVSQKGAFLFDIIQKKPNFLWILLTAFFAGILLNLMPCVFPILSLKAIQIVQDARYQKGRFFRAIAYTSGVVLSFFVIATLLYLLKQSGAALGWGFQLQSPFFVFAMIILFLLISLQSLDIIHIKLPMGVKIHKISGLNSFMTGFFAVLIASPCTGPFMGAAIGYALFQSAEIYFPVFLFLGLGYALPFALLEIFPFIIKKMLPKPGIWMRRLKYILSIPIFCTVLWLSWVFYHQIQAPKDNGLWKPYTPQALEAALDKGDAVFIDFTAKWCLTCLLNEQTVLNSKEFSDMAYENKITLLKADWTNRDTMIFEALKNYDRSSIPLYVFYPKGKTDHITFPIILTLENLQTYMEN